MTNTVAMPKKLFWALIGLSIFSIGFTIVEASTNYSITRPLIYGITVIDEPVHLSSLRFQYNTFSQTWEYLHFDIVNHSDGLVANVTVAMYIYNTTHVIAQGVERFGPIQAQMISAEKQMALSWDGRRNIHDYMRGELVITVGDELP